MYPQDMPFHIKQADSLDIDQTAHLPRLKGTGSHCAGFTHDSTQTPFVVHRTIFSHKI